MSLSAHGHFDTAWIMHPLGPVFFLLLIFFIMLSAAAHFTGREVHTLTCNRVLAFSALLLSGTWILRLLFFNLRNNPLF